MMVIINPHAGGNTALQKWDMICPELLKCRMPVSVCRLNEGCDLGHAIADALQRGEKDFVAAGGDGTVNAVLNAILETADPEQLGTIRLGAIGLGSSNDFHKPFSDCGFIGGIPHKLNFGLAAERDIGCVAIQLERGHRTKYFLNNASIGVTAQANALFNTPGGLLAFLRRSHTPSAILLAALQAIARFKNFDVFLQGADGRVRRTRLSNLAVIKNPHFSGDLRYDLAPSLDSGFLQMVLCENMSRLQLIKLFRALGSSSLRNNFQLESWKSTFIAAKSTQPFAVEFDGEVLTAQEAHFSLLPRCLRVCTC